MKVTLLGTGNPTPRADSFSASTLVEAGNQKLLFDLGRGTAIRLFQKKIPLGSITAHFLTHLHSDHVVGLPDVWLTGWIGAPFGARKSPLVIFGPAGTVDMTRNLTKAFAEDIRIRMADEHYPAAGVAFSAKDIEPGLVYEHDGVRVTAIEVNHGELIKPAFGYVIDYDGKKVVLSGDTKYDERIAESARGADLLIHEVAIIDPELVKANPMFRDIQNHHTSPEEAGRIFSIAKPKLAVFSHIVFVPAKPLATDAPVDGDQLVRRTRTGYEGPLTVGRDMMSFVVSDTVRVLDPAADASAQSRQ
ncbi:MBL fold metallo-hydrolase [Bradyrhizobium tropiciagri]|nr:MBL fold metallo-hydrolase [Bradyrhizobium tropiciagri]